RTGDNWELLEGVVITAGAGLYTDYTAFEEAQVQVMGSGAQMPGNGVWVNTIVSSGSNTFHGDGFYSLTGPWAQSNNIDADLASKGVTGTNKLVKRFDFNGDLSGFLLKDKLWFYS